MKKWAILGGDKRQIAMLQQLRRKGADVSAWGLGSEFNAKDWQSAVCDADIVVLPLPVTEDGVRIRCSLQDDGGIRFSSLLKELQKATVICGGKIPELWREQADRVGIRWYDYFQSEQLQMRNALPTVEAALFLAMEALSITLDGCHAAVLGYGRIGSLLAEKLRLLGADVTVYARKERDLAHAELRHCHAIPLIVGGTDSTLRNLSQDCRIVFNTVPHPIVDREALSCWRRDVVLMELATIPPGGFDIVAATEMRFPLIIASALPGKYFPETAGNILADTLLEWSGECL